MLWWLENIPLDKIFSLSPDLLTLFQTKCRSRQYTMAIPLVQATPAHSHRQQWSLSYSATFLVGSELLAPRMGSFLIFVAWNLVLVGRFCPQSWWELHNKICPCFPPWGYGRWNERLNRHPPSSAGIHCPPGSKEFPGLGRCTSVVGPPLPFSGKSLTWLHGTVSLLSH